MLTDDHKNLIYSRLERISDIFFYCQRDDYYVNEEERTRRFSSIFKDEHILMCRLIAEIVKECVDKELEEYKKQTDDKPRVIPLFKEENGETKQNV